MSIDRVSDPICPGCPAQCELAGLQKVTAELNELSRELADRMLMGEGGVTTNQRLGWFAADVGISVEDAYELRLSIGEKAAGSLDELDAAWEALQARRLRLRASCDNPQVIEGLSRGGGGSRFTVTLCTSPDAYGGSDKVDQAVSVEVTRLPRSV